MELLVALAIFAVVFSLAHGAIRAALEARERIGAQSARLGGLQRAMAVLERDLSQMIGRPIRDENGEPLPALYAPDNGEYLLEFTRAGWPNPAGARRGNLRRVAYAWEGKELLRLIWPVLDRAPDSRPSRSLLLSGVEGVEIRFLPGDNVWQATWPPGSWEGAASLGGSPSASGGGLPGAVEIILEVAGFGRIRRVVVISH